MAMAAVIAALSPQNFWDNNVGLAERFIKHWSDAKTHMYDPAMDKELQRIRKVQTDKLAEDQSAGKAGNKVYIDILDTIKGKNYSDLAKIPDISHAKLRRCQGQWLRMFDEAHGNKTSPVYSPDGSIRGTTTRTHVTYDMTAKAIDMLESGTKLQDLHEIIGGGQKIRNFYNNIINPWSKENHVTIDTHAVGAAHGKPVSSTDKLATDNFAMSPKVGELGVAGLLSGVRAGQTANRAALHQTEPGKDGETRIHPLLGWSEEQAAHYFKEHGLLRHPLYYQGYGSVGDWTTTLPGQGREGRELPGSECGLHVTADGRLVRAVS